MPYYSEQPDAIAEVQAMAVELLDKLAPVLSMAIADPRPGAWAELARVGKHLQEFYELSFVQLAAHPEPGRSEQLADVISAMIDHAAHREESHRGQRPLTFQEKVACAENAFTTVGHLLGCLAAIGQSMPGGATIQDAPSINEQNVDQVLRQNLEYVERVYHVLATATLGMRWEA